MKKNIEINITVGEILAICHIIDEYEDFIKNLYSFLKTRKGEINYVLIDKLTKVSRGERCFNSKKATEFYDKNKSVIEEIRKYISLHSFIYGYFGVYIKKNDEIEYMYQYLTNNKDKMDNIIEVLEKIKGLGIKYIVFNENKDFTKETYQLDNHDRDNFEYLDNMIAIPNYNSKILKYKTVDSNYKIAFSYIFSKIILNSLVFDAKTLPDKMNSDELYIEILNLGKEIGNESDIVNDSVNLAICVDELELKLDKTEEIINGLDSVGNKEELVKSLTIIKQEVEKMGNLSIQNNINIIEENEHITEEILNDEKKLELNRRFLSSLHVD